MQVFRIGGMEGFLDMGHGRFAYDRCAAQSEGFLLDLLDGAFEKIDWSPRCSCSQTGLAL